MKKKIALALSLAALALAGCNSTSSGGDSSVAPASASSTEQTTASEEPETSSNDPDDQIYNRNDGKALEVKDVSNPYTVGTTTNGAVYNYDSVYANKPTNSLSEDFAWGVDCSSLYDVEKAGGRFYDEEGKEADLFKILKAGGANYARFRLWVDPYDANGVSYGGGSNDISTDVYLAKRAAAAGMKILIDFHYSDSWADPSKQWAPKAWTYLSKGKHQVNEKTQYKRVGDYTAHALNAFKDAGVNVDAVQIGNETNNGMAGSSNSLSWYFAQMIKAGVDTAKDVFPSVKTIVHLTNITNPEGVYKIYKNLIYWEVDWDVCGLSYYPFWHGGRENLQTVMDYCASTFNKEVMIVETSWGYTVDGASYCNNQYKKDFEDAGGYLTSCQAQVSELADLTDCLSKVPEGKGTGLFYWEPAWLPRQGSGWISKTGYYYNDNGYDYVNESDLAGYTDSSCWSSWANQAWFDYSGKALPSYKAYKLIQDGSKEKTEEAVGANKIAFTGSYNLSDNSSSIPTSGMIKTNLDRLITTKIVWDSSEIEALKTAEQGRYTIHGKLGSYDVTCDVNAFYNYVKDPSFENQNTLQGGNANEYKVTSPWELTASVNGVRVEAKNECTGGSGTHYFHWWSSSAFTFTLSQKLSSIPAGTYALSTHVITHMKDEYGGYNKIALFYQIGSGDKVEVSMLDKCAGYGSGLVEWSVPSIVVSSESDVTIGMICDAGATTWGHNDDWSFTCVS